MKRSDKVRDEEGGRNAKCKQGSQKQLEGEDQDGEKKKKST